MSDSLLERSEHARAEFLSTVQEIRPDLHRYCARMTGSVTDGEDIVQETLARAYYALPELKELPPWRPWLFRIAHNAAINHLQRYERRMSDPLETIEPTARTNELDAEEALAREQAVTAAISKFVELPASQRSAVILKDVLGHSLEEIATLLETSVPSVKATIHRGREHLKNVEREPKSSDIARSPSAAISRYAALFNARDWDGVRAMLVDDARLDVVTRSKAEGKRAVGSYFTNYAALHDWHLVPAWLEGREVLAVLRNDRTQPAYVVEIEFVEGRVSTIRDFRYVPYILRDATIELAKSARKEDE